ncbi:MAG: sulfite exporter TauE/SafE family protein [Imperialibacter sp.]|uniref:sulfite exporter TauE/SafE family protein n=1 Tax=Imperialibacter sp. TaxID=2038411 RepID=UPI0032ECA9FF
MIELFSYELSHSDLWMILSVSVLIGMSKTGVHGAGMIAVPLLAAVFGGKQSSGFLLPILCLADIFGVVYYHRHAAWDHLWKLFPWAAAGTLLGTWVGNYIDDEAFKLIMAIIIFVSVGLMIWLEKRKKNEEKVPAYFWFAALMGVAGGFTSMVGNLAGSVMALYLLSVHLPKNSFIGTAAWFFMVLNWFKLPFHIFSWHTITVDSFLFDLVTLPAIGLGALIGVAIIKEIPEKQYRWFIIAMTVVAAFGMLL